MGKYNWGIVGTGWIGGEMAQTLSDKHGEIYSITSTNSKELKEFMKKYPVKKIYYSLDELLNDKEVDIIYIATPHHVHSDIIQKSLEAGKNVISEKAITVNNEELEELIQLAKDNELVLMEAMTVLHMPLWKTIKDEVDKGLVGTVKMIQVNFGSHKEYDINNRFFNPDLAGGALLDIGGYAISVARLFMYSQPTEILTTVKYFETGVDEQSVIVLKNKEEQMASITLSMQAKQPKRVLITGDKGYIEVYDYPRGTKAKFVETETGDERIIEIGGSLKALAYEVSDMEKLIEQKEFSSANSFTLEVMKLMTKIREKWGFIYPFENK